MLPVPPMTKWSIFSVLPLDTRSTAMAPPGPAVAWLPRIVIVSSVTSHLPDTPKYTAAPPAPLTVLALSMLMPLIE